MGLVVAGYRVRRFLEFFLGRDGDACPRIFSLAGRRPRGFDYPYTAAGRAWIEPKQWVHEVRLLTY